MTRRWGRVSFRSLTVATFSISRTTRTLRGRTWATSTSIGKLSSSILCLAVWLRTAFFRLITNRSGSANRCWVYVNRLARSSTSLCWLAFWETRRFLTVATLAERCLDLAATRWVGPDCADATRSVSGVLKVASDDEVGSQSTSSAISGRYVRHRLGEPTVSFWSCSMLFPANPCQFGSGTWRRSIKNGAELSSFWHIDRAEWPLYAISHADPSHHRRLQPAWGARRLAG